MSLEGRTYQFRLTKMELAELALRFTWDSFVLGKGGYLILAGAVLLLNVVPFFIICLSSAAGPYQLLLSLPLFIFRSLENLSVFFLCLIVFKFLGYLWSFSRQPISGEIRLRLENGCLCDDSACAVHQGGSFAAFPETPGLLLLKRSLSRKSLSYLVLPKRLFTGPEEIRAFKAYLSTPAPQAQSPAPEACPCCFRFSFQLSPDDFAHVYTELMRIARIHRPFWRNGRIQLCLLFCFLISGSMAASLIAGGDLIGGVSIIGMGVLLAAFLLSGGASIREDTYRRQMRRNRFPFNGGGLWDLSFSSEGLTVVREQDSFKCSWDVYTHFYETMDTLFLLRIENQLLKQYIFIPKWALTCRQEQEAFVSFCHGCGKVLEFIHIPEVEEPALMQKKARIRTILLWTILAVYLLCMIAVPLLSGFYSAAR